LYTKWYIFPGGYNRFVCSEAFCERNCFNQNMNTIAPVLHTQHHRSSLSHLWIRKKAHAIDVSYNYRYPHEQHQG
jgi:hypothetical protein